jgi:hypothetical protein
MMSKVKISVSVKDDHLDHLLKVAADLKSAGMDVEQTMPNIGIVGGSIESNQVDKLYQIAGVDSVESEQGYQLAPPNSPVQ